MHDNVIIIKGILSAWELTDIINEECNDVSTFFTNRQDDVSINYDRMNSKATANTTTTSAIFENKTDTNYDHHTTKKALGEDSIYESVDPDSEVEWITSTPNYITEEYSINFPNLNVDPEIPKFWPTFFMDNIAKNSTLNRKRRKT